MERSNTELKSATPGERIVCPVCERSVAVQASTGRIARHGHRNGGGGMSLGGGACVTSGWASAGKAIERALLDARALAAGDPTARHTRVAVRVVAHLERALARCSSTE